MTRLVVLGVVAVLCAGAPTAPSALPAGAEGRAERYYAAAAVGAPGQDVPGAKDAGAVYLFPDASGYGDLVVDEAQVITRRMLGEEPSDGDRFGAAVVLTDAFDRGGELVVSAPGADDGAGVVYIIHTDFATGRFDVAHPTVIRQGQGGLPGTSEPGDRFGAALQTVFARGADAWLAIGAPGEDVREVPDAGAVTGIPLGNDTDRAAVFYQGGRLPGRAEVGDRFGTTLAEFADGVLAGAPDEDVGDVPDAGGVTAFDLYERTPALAYRQGVGGTPGAPERGDRFGAAMVDLDLGAAVGAPGEDLGSIRDAGTVIDLAGPESTILTTTMWFQGHRGVAGTAEPGDRFGGALTLGSAGLIIGVPFEDVHDVRDAGAIHFLPFSSGQPFGVDSDRQIHLDTPSLPGAPVAGDRFGTSVGSAADRVLVGVPARRVAGLSHAGALVDVEFLFTGRIVDPAPRLTTQATFGLDPEVGDRFGASMTSAGYPGAA